MFVCFYTAGCGYASASLSNHRLTCGYENIAFQAKTALFNSLFALILNFYYLLFFYYLIFISDYRLIR